VYKINDKQLLKDILYSEDYDKIVFWRDGTWNLVSSSYIGEQDGDDPVYSVKRVEHYNSSKKEINEFVDVFLEYNIEENMNLTGEVESYT